MRLNSFLGVALLIGLCSPAGAQTIVKPDAKISKTSFAIITDTPLWDECSEEMSRFAAQLQSEGLPALIVYDRVEIAGSRMKKVLKTFIRSILLRV